jgi:YidC/Oxa1 family membrane protein insertase
MSIAPLSAAYELATTLAALLAPVGGAAAAVVVFTIVVRLLLHPLVRSAVRGEKARARLAPKVKQIKEPEELLKLYREEGVSPFAGMLPMLAQIPFFLLCYQLFARSSVDGHANALLTAHVVGVPLNAHAWDARAWPVFAVLFAVLAVTAWVTARRSRRLAGDATGLMVKVAQVVPFTILISAAFLPLAAGMYLATSTAWSAAENAVLKRGLP